MRDSAGIQRRARAALASAFQFYALSITLIAVLFTIAVALALFGAFIRVPYVVVLAAPFAVAGGAIVRGIWPKPPALHPIHVLLDEPAAPELFAMLRSIAEQAQTEPPSRVMLVHGVVAGVREDRAQRGRTIRTLQLGAGLLSQLTVSELRAVLGHEFGHFYAGDTAIALRVYGMRQSMIAVVEETLRSGGERDLTFRLYRWMFERFERDAAEVAREQEILADEVGARVAGNATMIRAVRRVVEADAAFEAFSDELRIIAAMGGAPRNVYEGFRGYLRSPAWARAREKATAALLGAPSSPFDRHPTFDERALLLTCTAQSSTQDDDRPAWSLIASADHLESLLCEQTTPANLQRIEWNEFRRVIAARQRSLAERTQARAPLLDAAMLVDVLARRDQWLDFVCAIEPEHCGDASAHRDETVRERIVALSTGYFGTLLCDRGWSFHGLPGGHAALTRAGETFALQERLEQVTRDEALLESFVEALDEASLQLSDAVQQSSAANANRHLQRWSPVQLHPLGAAFELKVLLHRVRWPKCCVVCKHAATDRSLLQLRKQKGADHFALDVSLPACHAHVSRAHEHLRLREYDARNDVATFDTKDVALAQLIERVNA